MLPARVAAVGPRSTSHHGRSSASATAVDGTTLAASPSATATARRHGAGTRATNRSAAPVCASIALTIAPATIAKPTVSTVCAKPRLMASPLAPSEVRDASANAKAAISSARNAGSFARATRISASAKETAATAA